METVEEAMLKGQATIWKYMFSFADSMALRSAVELRIPDIIHSHGAPITLSQIASSITASSTPDICSCLGRIMRLLVRRNIFTADHRSDGGDTFYGLTNSSRWLLRDAELTLAPIFLMETHQWLMAPWHYLGQCVRDGDIAFQKAHGVDVWDFASQSPNFNRIFNEAMACTSKITTRAVVAGYKDGFESIGSLVDVGGGTGMALEEIVKAYPHIKGVNFDLPHVVATAAVRDGVTNVGGNMFEAIPNADAVFMKWIMHNWSDKDCVKILKNCRKAIPEKIGKVIIVDVVLQQEGKDLFDDTALIFDILMITYTSGGKERTELEWKKVLQEAGFPSYKVIKIPALLSIIEAYPE